MKTYLFNILLLKKTYCLFIVFYFGIFQTIKCQIPHIQKNENYSQLIVNNQPFIILGGELGNSSASTISYMEPIWPKLKLMNLNTILIPVYWELIEKEENKFDFSLVEKLIIEARKNDLKIVFLWFASWKNSMSSHVPTWIKLNDEKYPRVKDNNNVSHEILTPFSDNNLNADLLAFQHFMAFIKSFDSKEHTTIMIQVENEIGMLPTARDYHPLANNAFTSEVPETLITYLKQNKNNLVPEIYNVWKQQGFKMSGNWETVFGKGLHTDEIFMAWYFSKYTNAIIEAGKKIYPIPMFVNAALNKPNKTPGEYPSAGPLPHIMDVWKAAGPTIDFLAPDFYNPNFKYWNDLYSRQNNTLFIPEHQFDNTVAAKTLYAIGHYKALGFSPFAVDSNTDPENEPLGKAYNIVNQAKHIITDAIKKNKIDAVILDKDNLSSVIKMGDYEFSFKHYYTLPWESETNKNNSPATSAILIQTDENNFYIVGSGVVVTFKYLIDKKLNTGILETEEGYFDNNVWTITRYLNGDQTHQGRHIRLSIDNFSIQKFKLYTYK